MTTLKERLERVKGACERFMVVGPMRTGESTSKIDCLVVPKLVPAPVADDLFRTAKVSAVKLATSELVGAGLWQDTGAGTFVDRERKVIVAIHETTAASFVSKVVRMTGPMKFVIDILTNCKGLGVKWDDQGLICPKRGRLPVETEEDFFRALNMPWTDPKRRKFGSRFPGEPANKEFLTEAEFADWAKGSRFVPTKCGGEWHEYTVRVSQKSDDLFLRAMMTIHQFGTDVWYKGRPYRQLDSGGHFYFTCTFRYEEETLINRKKLEGPVRPWVVNPRRLRFYSLDKGENAYEKPYYL